MANNAERLDKVEARLRALEKTVGAKPEDFKSRVVEFFKRVWQYKGTIIVVTIILGIGGWFIPGWFGYRLEHKNDAWNRAVDDRIDSKLRASGGINETLGNVQKTVSATDTTLKTLSPFIQDVIRHQFESASKLPTSTLRERLPALRELIAVAANQKTKVDSKVVSSLSEKLLQIPNKTDEFWSAASSLVSYRSSSAANWSPATILPNCRDTKPSQSTLQQNFLLNGKPQKLEVGFIGYHACSFALDSDLDGSWLNTLILGKSAIFFKECVVSYNGGPIKAKLNLAHRNQIVDSVPGDKDQFTYRSATP